MSFETLNLAGSLLRASRLGMDAAGRNLAGSNEVGYTRQGVVYTEQQVRGTSPLVPDGLGVYVEGVRRARSGLADQVYRLRAQEAGGPEALAPFLADLEGRLSASGGIHQRSLEFEQGWARLAAQPDETALRSQVLLQGGQLAESLRTGAATIEDVRLQVRGELLNRVERTNAILTRLADLNPRLVASAPDSMSTNALLDTRDRLLDELSELVDVQVVEHPRGAVAVYQSGLELVALNRAQALTLEPDGTLSVAGRPLALAEGALGALQQFSTSGLDAYAQELDDLALTLRDQFNAVHSLGYGLDGATGRDFFSGTRAADLTVSVTDQRQLATAVARMESQAAIGSPALVRDLPMASQPFAVAPSASGTLLVNGVALNWTDGQTLQEILSGFSAAGVQASYDAPSRRVVLARDPSWPGPSDISVSDAAGNLSLVLALAAGSTPGGPADGATAGCLSQRLRTPAFGQGADRTLVDAGGDLIVGVGRQRAQEIQRQQICQEALDAARERRAQASGVNSEEELLQLQRFQQSFEAAARVAAVADETLSTLIREMRR